MTAQIVWVLAKVGGRISFGVGFMKERGSKRETHRGTHCGNPEGTHDVTDGQPRGGPHRERGALEVTCPEPMGEG